MKLVGALLLAGAVAISACSSPPPQSDPVLEKDFRAELANLGSQAKCPGPRSPKNLLAADAAVASALWLHDKIVQKIASAK